MSDFPNYPPPPPPPPWGPPPPAAAAGNGNWFLRHKILTGVAVLIVGTAVAGALGGDEPDSAAKAPAAKQAAAAAPSTKAPAVVQTPSPAPPVEPAIYEPTKRDFDLTIKTLEKRCFGSAGCNVTFRINLAYGGEPLDPEKTYEVTYSIRGGDEPLTNTLTITGEKYQRDSEEFIGTKTRGAKLSAVVTDVEESG